jgi:hypothetical protein
MSLGGLLLLCACDVQLRDTAPAEYPANHDLGMYEVSVAVTRAALVTPPSVQITNAHTEPRFECTAQPWHTQHRYE